MLCRDDMVSGKLFGIRKTVSGTDVMSRRCVDVVVVVGYLEAEACQDPGPPLPEQAFVIRHSTYYGTYNDP